MKALRGRKHEKVYAKALQSPGGGGLVPCGSYIDVSLDIFLYCLDVRQMSCMRDRQHALKLVFKGLARISWTGLISEKIVSQALQEYHECPPWNVLRLLDIMKLSEGQMTLR